MLKKFLIGLLSILACFTPLMSIGSTASALSNNLIANPSVESSTNNAPSSWTTKKTGVNTTAFNYLNSGHSGSYSLQIQMTKRTSGQAEWVFTPVTINPSTNYTYTDWYMSNVQTSLVVTVQTTTGRTATITTTSVPSSSSWRQSSVSFKTPANASTVSVYHYINRVGQVTLDDFDLEGPAPLTPSVNITSPINNATISGNSVIAASASNAVGVQFKVDGVDIGGEVLSSPYSSTWDTTTVANGTHTIAATARSTSGLTSTNSIVVNVQNVVAPPVTPNNLIANSSLEDANNNAPSLWLSGSWGTNTSIYTYENNGHTGSHSVKTQITSYTSGDAKWYFSPVAVETGITYNYSHYYESNVTTDVVVQFTDSNGNNTYKWLDTIGASSTWKLFSGSFVAPSGSVKATVFHILYSVGWVQIDDASLLAEAPIVADTIANGSFEISSGSSPVSWQKGSWGSNATTFEYMNEGHTGSHSAKVTVSNYVSGDAKWYFDPVTTLQRGAQYRFSTWYKTNSTPHATAMFILDDGTEEYLGMQNPQPNGSSDWQYYSDTFQVPLNAKAVSIFFFMQNNGWVQIDDQAVVAYQSSGFSRSLLTLTFDDGPIENVTNALPLLNSYGFKTTHCFISSLIENEPGQIQTNVMQFFNTGHEVCSHTVTHTYLTRLNSTDLNYELQHSQQYLESVTGSAVTDFVSPYGDYNSSVINAVKQYYQSLRTVDTGYNTKDNFDPYLLKVQNILNTTTTADVTEWVKQAQANNAWLILVYHRIATDAGQFDTYPTMFAQQLQSIQNSGITVETMHDALTEIKAQL